MKKISVLIIAFICVLGLVGCGKDANAVFQGKIIEINDEAMLVEPLPGYKGKEERINVAIQYMPSSPEPTVGDVIEVIPVAVSKERREIDFIVKEYSNGYYKK